MQSTNTNRVGSLERNLCSGIKMFSSKVKTCFLLGYLVLLLNLGQSLHHADFLGLHHQSESAEIHSCCCHSHVHTESSSSSDSLGKRSFASRLFVLQILRPVPRSGRIFRAVCRTGSCTFGGMHHAQVYSFRSRSNGGTRPPVDLILGKTK